MPTKTQSIDILAMRRQNQLLVEDDHADAVEVVRQLCAVQAQDYLGAKWAVAQRTDNATSDDIDKLFNDGAILRTHVLRPTWHFVAPEDLKWMVTLTAPRIRALSAYYFRKTGLDDAIFARVHEVIIKALQGHNYKTRNELAMSLQEAGIDTSDLLRLTYMVGEAELDAIICSGPLKGKQHTYALFNERVAASKNLSHEEALAELALRFFKGHGPATIEDYAWWSGLTKTDARKGFEAVKSGLIHEVFGDKEYWFAPTPVPVAGDSVYLLPNYDEYIVAYADRSNLLHKVNAERLDSRQNPLFNNAVVVNGIVVGTWKRTIRSKEISVALTLFESLNGNQQKLLDATIKRYGVYMGKPVSTEFL